MLTSHSLLPATCFARLAPSYSACAAHGSRIAGSIISFFRAGPLGPVTGSSVCNGSGTTLAQTTTWKEWLISFRFLAKNLWLGRFQHSCIPNWLGSAALQRRARRCPNAAPKQPLFLLLYAGLKARTTVWRIHQFWNGSSSRPSAVRRRQRG